MQSMQRFEIIKRKLKEKGYLTVVDIAEELGVSLPTVRKDFDMMSSESSDITRVRGGITLDQNHSLDVDFQDREKKNIQLKQEIAEKAINHINPYDTILIDSSSTCYELAKLLSAVDYKLTVITDGISTAMRLKENSYLLVVVVGGVVKKNSNSIDDEFGSNTLEKFNIDKYFFSASGVSLKYGLSEYNIGELKTKERMIKKVPNTYALIDSTKFEIDSNLNFANLSQVSCLITDSSASSDIMSLYDKEVKIY